MGDFEEKLESILNNPQAMNQIMSLAQSLGKSDRQTGPTDIQPPPPVSEVFHKVQADPQMISGLLSMFGNCEENRNVMLLNALRPFLKESRQAKIDKAVQVAKMTRMAHLALEFLRTKEDEHV